MTDTNMICPKCKQTEAFNICASVWGRYSAEGFDSTADDLPSYDNTWEQYAGCQCPQCGEEGIVEEFLVGAYDPDSQFTEEEIAKWETEGAEPLAIPRIKHSDDTFGKSE